MHGEVDGDVEDAGPLGKVHAEEEDVAPAGMREVHPHGGRFAEQGKHPGRVAGEEFGADPQGVVGRVPHAKHPLVAAQTADAAPNLVGERL